MSPITNARNLYQQYKIVLSTAAGLLGSTAILGIGGLAFWALVGHNAGSRVLGQAATSVSLATLASMIAGAGAIHLVIARKDHLRSLVSTLAIVCPVIAGVCAALFSSHARILVIFLAGGLTLGLIVDAAAIADGRPQRVTARAAIQVAGILSASICIHSYQGFIIAWTISTWVASSSQLIHWASRPDFSLLRNLGKDIWSYYLAGVTGQAPAFIVAPLAAILSTPIVAGEAYIAMALVGPLTSLSVSLSVGVHVDGKRSAEDTRRLFTRTVLVVLGLATIAALCTPLLHFAGPSFAAAAPFVAVMVFATVLDAICNIWSSLWRVNKRLMVVPILYIVELAAFAITVALIMPSLGIQSIVWGWYAQGVAGVALVFIVERRLIPRHEEPILKNHEIPSKGLLVRVRRFVTPDCHN